VNSLPQHFAGTLDEVEIFNRALSDDEVRAIYEARSAGKCGPQCAAPPPGMTAWWPGETNANDIQGGFDGSLVNGVGFDPGMVGSAFHFDGLDDYVAVPDTPALRGVGQITIDFWARFDRVPRTGRWEDSMTLLEKGNDYLVIWRADGNANGGTEIEGSIQIHFTDACDGPFFYHLGADLPLPNLPAGELHHFAFVAVDGGAAGPDIRIYMDGALQPAIPANDPPHRGCGWYTGPTGELRLGMRSGVNSLPQHFAGTLDEVEIFNRALSDDEVRAIYEARSAGKCLNQSPAANAGADATIACAAANGTPVTLDGSASSDPDGDTLTYTWTGPFPEGGGTVTGVSPTVTLPLGVSTITLTVDDGNGGTARDTVEIRVNVGVEGLLPPLAALAPEGGLLDLPSRAFKRGSTLPLKLRMSCGATALTADDVAAPRIVSLILFDDPVPLATIDPDAGEANDNGVFFRYSEPNWVYNLSSRNLEVGTYIVVIELPDGRRLAASFILR
jgi:hypothetical protein